MLETAAHIATIVTGLTVLIAAWQLLEAKKQRIRQFETTYIERYWHLMDELSEGSFIAIVRGSQVADSSQDMRAAYAYLLLSEDEAELRRTGWISDETWTLWAEYIHRQLQRPPFSLAWQEAGPVRPGEVHPFEHLRALEESFAAGRTYDPCRLSRARRRFRGLR